MTDRQKQTSMHSHAGMHINCKSLDAADKSGTFTDCYLRAFNVSASFTPQMFIHVRHRMRTADVRENWDLKGFNN